MNNKSNSAPNLLEDSSQKNLFIRLIIGTTIVLCCALFACWAIPSIGFSNIHPYVPYVVGGALIGIGFIFAYATFSLVFQLLTGKKFFGSYWARGVTIRFLLPLMEIVGLVLGRKKDEIRSSFITMNNQLCLEKKGKNKPEDILLLLPHCIQHASCSIRVNVEPNKCSRCGKCPVAEILAIKEKYGVHLAIATGGSLARKIVLQLKPSLIIAVACERDLASGIQDTFPLPVFGILNSRPEGPCYNTLVTVALLEEALRFFIKPENLSSFVKLPMTK